jgi:hypothetical protein
MEKVRRNILAAALVGVLAQVSRDIAAAIRATEEKRP